MKKSEITFLGIIIIVAVIGLLIFWYSQTIAKDSSISDAAKLVKPVDKNIFTNKLSQDIKNLEIPANVPVKPTDNYNNEDPFF